MDPNGLISVRYFREKCVFKRNSLVKDLSKLGRSLKSTILIDNSPSSYMLQPDNALPIPTWINDPTDTELAKLIPILELLANASDVRTHIHKISKNNVILHSYAIEYLKCEVEQKEKKIVSPPKHEPVTAKSNRLIIRIGENVSSLQCELKYSKEISDSASNNNETQETAHNCTPLFRKTSKVRIMANNEKINELSPNKLEYRKSPNYFTNLLKIKKSLATTRLIGRNAMESKASMEGKKWADCYGAFKRSDQRKLGLNSKSPRPTTMQSLQKNASVLRPPTGKLFHTNFLVSGCNPMCSSQYMNSPSSMSNLKVRSLLY